MSSLGPAAGDPGAVSSAAAWLSGLARSLTRTGSRAGAGGTVEQAWQGRAAREAATRHRDLLAATDQVAATLGALGALLQDHATDLTAAQADVRRVEQRATAAGLVVLDGRVTAPWGIRGVADGPVDDRTAQVDRLQRELDLGFTQLERRRARLVDALAEVRGLLDDATTPLRR